MSFFILFAFLLTQGFCNQVWDGDFQYYANTTTYLSDFYYRTMPSDTSGWYDILLGNIQIKSYVPTITTMCADLSSGIPYTLCQKITLQVGRKYQIKYDIYSWWVAQNMTARAYVNNKLVSSLHIPFPDSFGSQTDYFVAQTNINQLCFNQTHQPIPIYVGAPWEPAYGGMIDNISILPVNLNVIGFVYSINQVLSLITLESNITYSQLLASQLAKQYIITAQNKTFKNQNIRQNSNGFLIIQLQSKFSFALRQLVFNFTNDSTRDFLIEFNNQIFNTDLYFYYLINNQKKILATTQTILLFLGNIIQKTINFLRLTSCSYFILTLISFENLSLFYIFLNIQIVPEFTKNIYYQLLFIYLEQQSITSWFQKWFKLQSNPFQLSIESQHIQQQMQSIINKNIWFGTYDITSLVYNNNYESLFLLGLLALKLFVTKFCLKFMNNQTKKFFKINTYFTIIFVVQFISMIPGFLISAVTVLEKSCFNFSQNIQKVIQIVIIFLCIISIAFYSLLSFKKREQINQNKQLQIRKGKPRIKTIFRVFLHSSKEKTINKKVMVHTKFQRNGEYRYVKFHNIISDQFILITIPFLIILQSKELFLVANSFVITIKFVNFCYNYQIRKKIIDFLLNCVWVIHHAVFIYFYVLEKQNSNIVKNKQNNQVIISILGVSAVLTVLLGFFLELLKFSIWAIKFTIYNVKKVCKRIKSIDLQQIKDSQNSQKTKKNVLRRKQQRKFQKKQVQFAGGTFLKVEKKTQNTQNLPLNSIKKQKVLHIKITKLFNQK